tara:strand:- start:7009 stop:7692 length:684 start_codon:yes stop_codon:yes gene_type:complete
MNYFALFGDAMATNVGETLFYKASFRGIHAASASLEVIKKTIIGKDSVYHIQFKAKTRSAFNYIFPIDDKIDLWIDTKTFLPLEISEKIREGNFKRSTSLVFNRQSNYAIIDNDTLKIEKYTQSPYSLFYFFRKHNIKNFKDKRISLIQNKKTVILKLKVIEDQIVNVPSGSYNCTTVSPISEDNKMFKNKAELDIMFSNDIMRYPVMIRLKLKYGYLKLELDRIIN